MKVIGLTGGIGSGKSTVADFLEEFGASILDADKLGHEAFLPGTGGWQDVVDTFGRDILTPDNVIDRKKLSKLVFGKPDTIARLNNIMHPRILEIVKSRLVQLKQQGVSVVILEVILLIEAGWISLVDEVWVTVASRATILKRLQKRNGYSEEESLTRIHSQSNDEYRIKHATAVIDTDCTLPELKAKVKTLWSRVNPSAN